MMPAGELEVRSLLIHPQETKAIKCLTTVPWAAGSGQAGSNVLCDLDFTCPWFRLWDCMCWKGSQNSCICSWKKHLQGPHIQQCLLGSQSPRAADCWRMVQYFGETSLWLSLSFCSALGIHCWPLPEKMYRLERTSGLTLHMKTVFSHLPVPGDCLFLGVRCHPGSSSCHGPGSWRALMLPLTRICLITLFIPLQ